MCLVVIKVLSAKCTDVFDSIDNLVNNEKTSKDFTEFFTEPRDTTRKSLVRKSDKPKRKVYQRGVQPNTDSFALFVLGDRYYGGSE